jgi:hypothetical protein
MSRIGDWSFPPKRPLRPCAHCRGFVKYYRDQLLPWRSTPRPSWGGLAGHTIARWTVCSLYDNDYDVMSDVDAVKTLRAWEPDAIYWLHFDIHPLFMHAK